MGFQVYVMILITVLIGVICWQVGAVRALQRDVRYLKERVKALSKPQVEIRDFNTLKGVVKQQEKSSDSLTRQIQEMDERLTQVIANLIRINSPNVTDRSRRRIIRELTQK